ncbi:MAG: glycosyl hydrolase [Verrucomicrobiota bacterium]
MTIFEKTLTNLVLASLVCGPWNAGAEEAYQLTQEAWGALGDRNWAAVAQLADRSDQRWGATARKANRQLNAYPKEKEAGRYALLNELATITFIKGEALRKKGSRAEAMAAYRMVEQDFTYGQCWDPNGWWWKPAEAAGDALAKMAPELVKEIKVDAPPLKPELRLPGKKGVCFSLRNPDDPRGGTWTENIPLVKALNASWNYSWGSRYTPVQPTNLEFLPMAWGAWSEEGLRHDLRTHVVPRIKSGHVKRFLGFNEPDKHDQANMNYRAALKYWPILESLNIPLCSPACANPEGIDDDTIQGVKGTWMRDFMKEADRRGYRVDYIGVHWYGDTGAQSFKAKLARIYEMYGRRPLLVSEFAPADWGAKKPTDNRYSRADVLTFMKDVLPWMEQQDWIAGYAWFSFGYRQSVGTSSALFDDKGKLTALGRYYASVTPDNPTGDQTISY